MNEFEERCKEVIVLGDLLGKQPFRTCFLSHFARKVQELQDALPGDLKVEILQKLQFALLKPLVAHLWTAKNSTEKCLLIECVSQVLKLTLVHTVNQFFDVYSIVFFQIFKGGNLPYHPSEELQIAALECCTLLIEQSTEGVLKRVYSEESAEKFSLGISVSVAVVKEERNINLRFKALNFLLAASKYHKNTKFTDESFDKIGDLFMLYLPGILAPLLEVILRDETQHHLITVKALSCWGHILCLVMRDSLQKEDLSESKTIEQWLSLLKDTPGKKANVKEGLKEKKRTKYWVESAAEVLHPSIVKISEVRKHSNSKCRLELTRIMVNLLRNCVRNLKKSLPSIIETLVSSAMDEDAEVSQVAEEGLSEFEAECNEKNFSLFLSVMEENLYSIANRLPRIVQSGDEGLILASLKSFSGYIRILGRGKMLEGLLALSSTLRKLMSAIRVSCELEAYPEISNQDFSIWDREVDSTNWRKPWKRFRHFADEFIRRQLEDVCRSLGEFGPAEEIFDFLVDSIREDCTYRKELFLVMNEVVVGSKEIPDHVLKYLVHFYLEPENLYLPLEVNGDKSYSLKEARGNVMQVALIIEGIGKLAKSVGKRFQDYLFDSLYYVMERMESSFSIIREAATKTGVEIANACGLNGDVQALIQKNVDYLTYYLTIKLKKNDESVFDVVTVLVKNSPLETMPNIEEIIKGVLKSSSENVDSPHTMSYLRLFQTFVVCVNRRTKMTDKEPFSEPRSLPSHVSGANRVKKLLDGVKVQSKEKKKEDLPEQKRDEEEVLPEESEKPELPRHLKLTVSVANHCLHYLASKDKDKKLVALEILEESVRALAYREDDLLPLVHKIWSPLVTKFDQMRDPLLISRSFSLLCTLSHTSKDFIRSRTLKYVLPALESFLLTEATKSKLKDSSSGYFFTQGFKLQRELLENLGKMSSSLRLFERQTDLVAECALPYLSRLQPRPLQEKCLTLFEDLAAYDPYLVWFKVHGLGENPEFAKNAESVLGLIKKG